MKMVLRSRVVLGPPAASHECIPARLLGACLGAVGHAQRSRVGVPGRRNVVVVLHGPVPAGGVLGLALPAQRPPASAEVRSISRLCARSPPHFPRADSWRWRIASMVANWSETRSGAVPPWERRASTQ